MSVSMHSKKLRLGSEANDQFVSTSETSTTEDSADSRLPMQEEALSNDLILQAVFSHLSVWDLESCATVNKTWESAARLLRKDVIRIESHKCPNGCNLKVVLTARNANATKHYQLSWADVIKCVEEASIEKTYVHLILERNDGDVENAFREEFLPKCGHLVSRLDIEASVMFGIGFSMDFFRVVHATFPNVKYISLSGDFSLIENHGTWKEFKDQKLAELRVIDFGRNSIFPDNFVPGLLEYFSNFEHLLNFPLNNVRSLALAGKCATVRSVVLPQANTYYKNHVDMFVRKLASSEPKITNFNWRLISVYDFLRSPAIQTSLKKLFESSKETMMSLVGPIQVLKYVKLPTMSKLEHLTFEQLYFRTEYLKEHSLFQKGTNFQEIFPSVKTMTINYPLKSRERVKEHFPRTIFLPFGFNIECLTISAKLVQAECILELSILFPDVTNLSILWSTQMHSLLDQVYKNWAGLRVLTLTVDCFADFSGRSGDTFDAAVIGLSSENCNGLRTNARINVEDLGTLSSLKDAICFEYLDLEKLNVIVADKKLSVRGKAKNFITSRTIEYLKEFLPAVKVFIGISRDCVHVKDIMELLTSVLPYVDCDPCYQRENTHNVLA